MVQMLMHTLAHFFISVVCRSIMRWKLISKKVAKFRHVLGFFSVFEEKPDTRRFRERFRNFSVTQLPIVSSFITCERIHLANKLLSFSCKTCWGSAKLLNQKLKIWGVCYFLIMSHIPKKKILGVLILTM